MTVAHSFFAVESSQPVDPRSTVVWRWSLILSFVPPAIALTIATVAISVSDAPVAPAFWITLPLMIAFACVIAVWYPPARYRRLRYRVDDLGITVQDGIFFRTQSAVPHVRIQHTDVSQGPLERRYGVATLKLYTAGSRFTKIELPGLEHAAAIALRDHLQRSGSGDAI